MKNYNEEVKNSAYDVSTKQIIAQNLKTFIDYTGRSYAWFIEKTNIPSATFYKLVNGEGDIEKHIPKIRKLYGIDDPFFFHTTDFKLPERAEKPTDITQLAAANYVYVQGEEKDFEDTLNMLNDFVNVLELLKKNTINDPENIVYK